MGKQHMNEKQFKYCLQQSPGFRRTLGILENACFTLIKVVFILNWQDVIKIQLEILLKLAVLRQYYILSPKIKFWLFETLSGSTNTFTCARGSMSKFYSSECIRMRSSHCHRNEYFWWLINFGISKWGPNMFDIIEK